MSRSEGTAFDSKRVTGFEPEVKSVSCNACVYRLPSTDAKHFVVAKAARASGPAMWQQLRKEYSALLEVESRAGHILGTSVPRPPAFLEEQGILVLSGVAGVSLDETLRRQANTFWGRFRRRRMYEAGCTVGRWLHQFHDATTSRIQSHHHSDYLRELDSNMYRSRHLGLSTSTLHEVRDRMEAASASASARGAEVNMAAAHGDFLPQNILLYGTRVGVVDFGSYYAEAPVYRDLAHLSAYLTLLRDKLKYCRSAIRSLEDGFLAGYGSTLHADLLALYRVNATLRVINDRERTLPRHRAREIEKVLLALSKWNGAYRETL
jgi:aminoglycoside phosphotransferase (APT) family kinase protein